MAHKSARRTGPCLRFLDIHNLNAPQHAIFEENEITGLPVKQKKESTQQTSSPAKRKAKPTGKRTEGRPATKTQNRGMTLETEILTGNEKTNVEV